MSIDVMTLVWRKAPYQGNTMLALLALADWSDDDGKSWPAIETLAKKSRQSERNCRTVIRYLQKQKMIRVEEREGTSNMFIINLDMLGGQSLPPAKISKRGGLRRKSLPKTEAVFAPYTPDTSIDQKHTSEPLSSKESFALVPEESGSPKQKTFALPEWVPQQSWERFIAWRNSGKSVKKQLTDDQKQLLANRLEKLTRGIDGDLAVMAGEILDQSTMNQWQGLFPIKDWSNGNGNSKEANRLADARAKLNAFAGAPDAGSQDSVPDGAVVQYRGHKGAY